MTSFSDIANAMQEKSKELDVHLNHLKKLNEELRDRSEKILVALEKLVGCTKNNDKSCTVCYSRPRTHAVLCGHCYCQNCAQRCLDRGRCYVCRKAVTEMVRIYL